MEKKIAIVLTSERCRDVAKTIVNEWPEAHVYCKTVSECYFFMRSVADCTKEIFLRYDVLVYVGALGICVRSIAPFVGDKYRDPAVICIDSTARFVVSVLSGHVGQANIFTAQIAAVLGAQAVVTTQSDNMGLWALDCIGDNYNWGLIVENESINGCIFRFVNRKPTALLLDIRDKGTEFMERCLPKHVSVFFEFRDIDIENYDLLIAVTPFIYATNGIATVYYRPKVLSLGVGCRKDCSEEGVADYIDAFLLSHHIAGECISCIGSVDLKKDEALLKSIGSHFGDSVLRIFSSDELKGVEVPNPCRKVELVTGSASVSEASAILCAEGGPLLVEKQKGKLSAGNDFTFAVALDGRAVRKGHIEIVGAGPGDPDLISVAGRYFLESADLILYAGSLVPVELTFCAKAGATVRSSACLDLEEQFNLMRSFYDRGKLVVRLHTGDPCIYGAIQEQMAFFDAHGMGYHITPGISSFQAAAAALNSQFTIPERVQSIILTRGEGRTPMPEKEKLHLLAQSQSTMCIYLSATVVEQVQRELLMHYAPTTPVAVCYRLTWKDERIYRGELKDLSCMVRENGLTLTTLLVIGEAIGNRKGLSKLYSHSFTHLFRKQKGD